MGIIFALLLAMLIVGATWLAYDAFASSVKEYKERNND